MSDPFFERTFGHKRRGSGRLERLAWVLIIVVILIALYAFHS